MTTVRALDRGTMLGALFGLELAACGARSALVPFGPPEVTSDATSDGAPSDARLVDAPRDSPGCVASCTGVAVTLATGQDAPFLGRVDDTYVYWMTATGDIQEVPKSGGASTTLASGITNPLAFAVDESAVYWSAAAASVGGPGIIAKRSLRGGPPVTLAQPDSISDVISVDSGRVYFAPAGTVVTMGLDGSAVTTLATGQAGGVDTLLVGSESLYWTSWAGGPQGSLVTLPLGGGMPMTLSSSVPDALLVSLVGSSLYFFENPTLLEPSNDNTLASISAGGGAVSTVVASPAFTTWAVSPAQGRIYAAYTPDSGDAPLDSGTISVIPIGGGSSVTLATGQDEPQSIFADPTSVYWANYGSQSTGSVNQGKGPPNGSIVKLTPSCPCP